MSNTETRKLLLHGHETCAPWGDPLQAASGPGRPRGRRRRLGGLFPAPGRYLLLFFLFCTVLPCRLACYELAEMDGDETAGNAPVLLGWPRFELPLHWAVVADNHPAGIDFEEYRDAVSRAFRTWQDIPGSYVCFAEADEDGAEDGVIPLMDTNDPAGFSPLRTLSGDRRGPPFDDGYHNVVACVDEGWNSFGFSESALAVTWYAYDKSTRRLSGADIFINCGSRRSWAVLAPNASSATSYDLLNTVVHEVGHFIGLAHPYAAGREESTMYYLAAPGETSKRSLEQDDINGAVFLYPEPGEILVPPDSDTVALSSLSNPAGGGGCQVSPLRRPRACRLGYETLPAFLNLVFCLLSILAAVGAASRRPLRPGTHGRQLRQG